MSEKTGHLSGIDYSLHILFEEYLKILKVNFFTGEYRVIKTLPTPATERAMREKRFENYIRRLGESGQIHRDDAKIFVRYMNGEYVREKLLAGKHVVIHGIRYKVADVYVWTTIEMYVPHGLSRDNSWALFTVRESETESAKQKRSFPEGCCKLLKVNLSEDSYEIICARENELAVTDIAPKLSEWFALFAEEGVFEEDRQSFREFANVERLRREFSDTGSWLSFSYRRRHSEGYYRAEMGLVLGAEYTDRRQIVFLYVKDDTCNDLRIEENVEYYSERDVSLNVWNRFRYDLVCEKYSNNTPRPVGAITAVLPAADVLQSGRLMSFAWLLANEFGREYCFFLGDGSFLVLMVGDSEDTISRCADKLRKRLEKMGDRTEVSWAWHNAPARIEEVVASAEQRRRTAVAL